MRKSHFWKNEKGSVSVIVALSLSVLFGFSALAIDYGMMASCKQSMQNAADAAALAGAQDLGTGAGLSILNTVHEYCEENGFDPDAQDVTVTIEIIGNNLKVTIEREMKMGFSSLLTGENVRQVSTSATAQAVSVFGACPYALFAGQRIEDYGFGIDIVGNNELYIDGNIHSNSDINMHRGVLSPGSTATAVRNVFPSTSGWTGHSIVQTMPTLESFEASLTHISGVIEFPTSVIKNGRSCFSEFVQETVDKFRARIGGPIPAEGLYVHIRGDLIFNGYNPIDYELPFPITVIVDGNVTLNGAPMEGSLDMPITLVSRHGNVTINGGYLTYCGTIFVPNGNVEFHGIDAIVNGGIIAQNIKKTGGNLRVTYHPEVTRYQPTIKVHLIQ